MSRERLLTLSVVLLLVLNFGVLGYLFVGQQNKSHYPPPHHGPGGPPRVDRIIIETLGYDDKQQAEFENLKHDHRSQIIALDEQYNDLLLQYFGLLKGANYPPTQKDSLETALMQIQNKKASVTFSHFQQLKDLCTAEQKPKFDSLIPQLLPILVGPKHQGPPHTP